MFKFIILAASAALASAYTTPTTQCTDGCNPIAKPGLDEVVPAGSAYTVTWQPTTSGTVTIVLMKGPSNNIQPLYPIAQNVANTGTYSWTPAADLEPTGDTGYGFQLIDDADGTYQWSTQFGISNPAYSGSASASASTSGSASSAPSSPTGATNGTVISTATTEAASAPTGYSNSTAIISSPSGAPATTLTTTGSGATGSSSSTSPSSSPASNGAATIGAASIGGAFAAIMAAVAVL